MSSAQHCAVIRNPFSTAVASAKIPDGATSLSTSSRLSSSQHIAQNQGALWILLHPSFFSGLSVYAYNGSSDALQQTNMVFDVPSRACTLSDTAVTFEASVPSQYRIVSQGARFTLLNNSFDNDGWFEAIRVNAANSPGDFKFNKVTKKSTVFPDMTKFESAIFGTTPIDATRPDWSMNPTYIAGKLRDLHKHTFILHREDDCTYIELKDTAWTTSSGAISTCDETWWVDSKCDYIAIRCFANVSPTSSSGQGKMSLHCHLVQHVEETFSEQSDIYRYQTACPSNKKLLDASLRAMRREIKPSLIRAPTMPVSTPAYNRYAKRKRKRSRYKKR